jgi:hypothetical protein
VSDAFRHRRRTGKLYCRTRSDVGSERVNLLFHLGLLCDVRMFVIDLYSLPNILRVVKSRRIRWAGHVARMGEDRGVHRVLVGRPEGKRPLGRPRRRWEDNIKMELQEVGGGHGDWMELAQDRDRWRALVGTVRDFRVP